MGDFTRYLAESIKEYDYKIKVAGELDAGFCGQIGNCLSKV